MTRGKRSRRVSPFPLIQQQQQQATATAKMPSAAVHKSKQKGKSRSAGGVEYEYARRIQALDEDEDVPIGRITKIENARNRVLVTFYDAAKKQVVEVKASIPDKNIERLGPSVGSFIVPVPSGKNWEIFLILSDEDARRRSSRIHKSILNFSFTGNSSADEDCGIEFVAEDEGKPEAESAEEDKKSKKEKLSKHVERVLRQEINDDDVDVDNI